MLACAVHHYLTVYLYTLVSSILLQTLCSAFSMPGIQGTIQAVFLEKFRAHP